MIGDGLSLCGLAEQHGVLHCAGFKTEDSTLYYQRSDDDGVTLATFAGSGTERPIGLAEEEQPSVVVLPTGTVAVSYSNANGNVCAGSKDGGETWQPLDTLDA